MKRKLAKVALLISLILLLLSSQIFSQSQIKLLERAYQESSDSLMQIFFDKWKQDLPAYPLSFYEHADDTLKEIVEIYKLFYQPQDYERIKNGINSYVNSTKISDDKTVTLLIPKFLTNNFSYGVLERILYFEWYEDPYWASYAKQFEGNTRMDTIKPPEIVRAVGSGKIEHYGSYNNFRPMVKERDLFFLDSTYYGIINSFFTGHFNKSRLNTLSTVHGMKYINELDGKLNFLDNYIPVFITGCQNEYLEIYDEDIINKIVFNRSLTQAVVSVRNNNTNYLSYYLKKTSDGWIIKAWSYLIICCG